MNTRQYSLLQLVKEIDAFCKEHDITYYCAAGTVLGAIRHGGFIPWDDDIDILMTRSEFCRFTDAFQQYGPKDRTVEFYEGNHEHHSTVPRYIREGSSMFCHYHITGHAAAGILIDIFILDPLPDGQQAQEEYLAKFYAYADLIAPTLSYSNRLPEKYSHIIEQYEKEASEIGSDTVAVRISRELFSYEESDCDRFILRWGSTPFIYPKDLFGEPCYMDFEDISIPVPSQWTEYLTIHYGTAWTDIPYTEAQAQHSSVFSTVTDYHELYSLRDSMFVQAELEELHQNMKLARRRSDLLSRPLEDYAADLRIHVCLKEIENNLRASGCNSAEYLFDNKQYSQLVQVYKPYIDLQTSIYFMGSSKHGAAYRWLFPVIVPLGDEALYYVLLSLIYTGKTKVAEKILAIHRRAGRVTERLVCISKLISRILSASGAYYSGNHAGALSVIRSVPEYGRFPDLSDLYWLASVHTGLTPEDAERLCSAASEENASPALKKAYADWLWSNGKRDSAETVYRSVMSSCRNGMFLKDIHEKGLYSIELPAVPPVSYVKDEASLCIGRLLEEISTICADNNITCIPCRDLTNSMLLNGAAVYGGNDPELLMTAPDAASFIEAFDRLRPEERNLLSWKNCNNIRGFALRYVDTSSLSIDLSRPGDWQNKYIGVTIRILRSSSAGKRHKRLVRRKEIITGMMDASVPASSSGVKKTAVRLLSELPDGIKNGWHRYMFADSMHSEASGIGDYYYYSYGNGLKPERHEVPSSVLTDIIVRDVCGHTYTISAEYADASAMESADHTLRPAGSIFRLQSAYVPLRDILTEEDRSKYQKLPWSSWRKAQKKTSSYDKEVRKVWLKMRDAALNFIG